MHYIFVYYSKLFSFCALLVVSHLFNPISAVPGFFGKLKYALFGTPYSLTKSEYDEIYRTIGVRFRNQ